MLTDAAVVGGVVGEAEIVHRVHRLLDGIPLPTHNILKTKTSQIESSEPYDPLRALYILYFGGAF